MRLEVRARIFLLIPCTLAGNDVFAQQQAATDNNQLQEIVVTANKRSSTVQDTAVSMTAVSGEDIENRGVADLTALATSIPGLSMRTGGPGETEFEMRGMTSTGGNSSTVGFYLGDTPLDAPTNTFIGKVVIDPNLYDLNRVEVLRGPQGTLYGSGSMGGTIKVVPNSPDPAAFDVSAEATLSGTDGGGLNHGENAMINLPFWSGSAALRVVGTEEHESGWIDRIVIAASDFPLPANNLASRGNVLTAPVQSDYRDVNDEDLSAVRAALLLQPSEALRITPSVFYQKLTQGGLNDIDSDPGTDAHYQPFDTPEGFYDRFTLTSLGINYQGAGFEVASTSSYWSREDQVRQDGSEQFAWALSTPSSIFPFYPSEGGIGPTFPTPLEDDTTSQISEEVRINSTGDAKFQWLFGYFYSDLSSQTNELIFFPDAVPVFGTTNAFSQYQPTKILQNSVFGEISYQLTSHLKATAGLRRYEYESHTTTSVSGFLSATGSSAVAASATGENAQGVNPKFDLSYDVDKDLLLYTTLSKGFRPGGGNQPIPTSGPIGGACESDLMENHNTTQFVGAPLSYGPDYVWSYEMGEKARLAGNRLTVNTSAYFEKWYDVQQYVPLQCGFVYTDNTGEAHVYGVELEINATPAPGLTLAVNGGFTHAYFAVGSIEAGLTAGTEVQDVPKWTSSATVAYSRPVAKDLAVTGRIENNYTGSRTDATYGINNVPAYDLTGLRFGVESSRWNTMFFVKNVFNQRALLSNTLQLNVNIPGYNRIAVSQPLTVGVDFRYHLGH